MDHNKALNDKKTTVEVDILNSCRVCMKTDGNKKSNMHIFDNDCDIPNKILYCTGIEFTKEEGLPFLICNGCYQDLSVAHKFKMLCILSHNTFQNMLKNKVKTEIEVDAMDDDLGMYDASIKDEYYTNDDMLKNSVTVENKPRKKRGPYKKAGKPRLKKMKFRRLWCEPCGLKFTTKQLLEEHRKKSHSQDIESWICEICGKVFVHRGSLSSHIRSHMPPEFACDQCDYKTSNKYDLIKHVRIHTGEKRYQCQHCTSAYYTSSNLTSHIRYVHEGLKKYACELCERRFFDKTKYMRHIDSHNNVKRFECEVCHSCYTRRCYWKKHLQRQHNIVIPAQRPGKQKCNLLIGQIVGTNVVGTKFNKIS
ncbi:unnamed protein product [Diatraea saccharalis]|uniref:Uncharacterized protein n=1 Tax=Diatraea saccharalis TaxID=40085 RepID=A0A9N9WFG6_9NEOP|nr:unnamed protein product [Diatraea saccharalis]